jgi:hypothetical protein
LNVITSPRLRATLTTALLLAAWVAHAQDIEPRRWSHLPIGANFAGVGYASTTGDIYLDPELKIQNATFDLQTIGVKYIRSFVDKLINLGNNRFSFRPQLGAVHNWGKWSAELTVAGMFFTDNNEFFNGKRLQQDPVYTADAHLIYTFRPGLWLASSVGYAGGGVTTVNGVSNDNNQSNVGWGLSLGLPISRAVGVKFGCIGTRTQVGTGQDTDTFACAISVMW